MDTYMDTKAHKRILDGQKKNGGFYQSTVGETSL
jgi:hypothetical protein